MENKLSVYVPPEKSWILEGIRKWAEGEDRSVNYAMVKAMEEFVTRRQGKPKSAS